MESTSQVMRPNYKALFSAMGKASVLFTDIQKAMNETIFAAIVNVETIEKEIKKVNCRKQ